MSTNKKLAFGLRRCTNNDIPAVMDINETTLPENYPLFFYEQILEKYPEAFTVAYLEESPNKLIGYIMWRVERGPSSFGLEYIKKGHLVSLAVLNEYRRKGVANSLLNYSMKIVQNYGVTEYVLEVRVSNTSAINLYQKVNNFERIKILNHYYRDGEDAFYMSYKLDKSNSGIRQINGLNERDIIQYYHRQNQDYLCYRCPKCQRLMLKALPFALPGSINPNDNSILHCADCGNEIKLYEIAQGKYDVVHA